MQKIIISGGTGFIGSALATRLAGEGYQVVILSRSSGSHENNNISRVEWDPANISGWVECLENASAVIHLAGENLGDGLWTKAKKERILASRLQSGQALVEAIKKLKSPPGFFIQSSAIGYYGTSETDEFTEGSPAGGDFLAEVAKKWEASTVELEDLKIPRAVIRTGIVLDTRRGAFPKLLLPFKLFAGGPLGNGRQWFSWIHKEDEVGAILHILQGRHTGTFNLTAPVPLRNREIAKLIAKVMHPLSWLPVPGFAMRLLLGEMSTLVLDGQKAVPVRLQSSGYKFKYEHFEPALVDLLKK